MARPRPQLPAATAIRALADDKGLIEVRVTPNASADEIALPAGDGSRTLSIRTTAAPEDGKANRAVLRLLSRALGLPASSLDLVRGATGRNKLVRIAG